MNKYIVKKVKTAPKEADWKTADIAPINLKPWPEEYHFNSYAQLLYDDEYIYVRMVSDETPVVVKNTERNSKVYTDSCLEFFLSPTADSPLYFNFEINALGALLTERGTGKKDRILCTDDDKQFNIKPQLREDGWQISYRIPFDYIKKYAGEYSFPMRGNFYKCGDETGHMHFGVWNMLNADLYDFHQRDYFGELIFED